MLLINEWKQAHAGMININWDVVEERLGFKLHDNIKDLYSRIIVDNNPRKNVRGTMEFKPEEFVKRYVNRDNWLCEANGTSKYTSYNLCTLHKNDDDYVCNFFMEAFLGDWRGGNDFGHRAYIGSILINIGQISLIFNNDTGSFEWVDFEYGYFEEYEENPYGIVADTAQEFLDKFNVDEEAMRVLAQFEEEDEEE